MTNPIKSANLLTSAPFNPDCEFLETLLEGPNIKLERIVSHGHRSPDGDWYDQERDEWISLLSGGAKLQIEGQDQLIDMLPGCHLTIPAHVRHRVEWTDETQETVWLVLYTDPFSHKS